MAVARHRNDSNQDPAGSLQPRLNIPDVRVKVPRPKPIFIDVKPDDVKSLVSREVSFNGKRIKFLEFTASPPDHDILLPPEPTTVPRVPLSAINAEVNVLLDWYSTIPKKRVSAKETFYNLKNIYNLSSEYVNRLVELGVSENCYYMKRYKADTNLYGWLYDQYKQLVSIASTVKKRVYLKRHFYKQQCDNKVRLYKEYTGADAAEEGKRPISTIVKRVVGSLAVGTSIFYAAREQLISLFDRCLKGYGTLAYVVAAVGAGLLLALSDFLVRLAAWTRINMLYANFHLNICLTDQYEDSWRRYSSNKITHEAVVQYATAGYLEHVKEFIATSANLRPKNKQKLLKILSTETSYEQEYQARLIELKRYLDKSSRKGWPIWARLWYKFLKYKV